MYGEIHGLNIVTHNIVTRTDSRLKDQKRKQQQNNKPNKSFDEFLNDEKDKEKTEITPSHVDIKL